MLNINCSLVTVSQASCVLCPHNIHSCLSGRLQPGLPAPSSLQKKYALATGTFCLLCPLIHLSILASTATSSVGKADMAEGQTGSMTVQHRNQEYGLCTHLYPILSTQTYPMSLAVSFQFHIWIGCSLCVKHTYKPPLHQGISYHKG